LERSTRPIVLDEHDRVAAPTPRGNQPGDVLLGRGIVAGSKRWILEAALNVHHQERTLFAHASDLIDRRAVRPNVATQSGCSAGRSISTNGTSPHPSRNRSLLPVRRNPARSTSPKAGPLGCTMRKYPVRFDAFPLSDVFDDFDEFVDAVAVVTGEGDELPRALDNGAQLRCAGDRDAAPAAELEKSLVAEHP